MSAAVVGAEVADRANCPHLVWQEVELAACAYRLKAAEGASWLMGKCISFDTEDVEETHAFAAGSALCLQAPPTLRAESTHHGQMEVPQHTADGRLFRL